MIPPITVVTHRFVVYCLRVALSVVYGTSFSLMIALLIKCSMFGACCIKSVMHVNLYINPSNKSSFQVVMHLIDTTGGETIRYITYRNFYYQIENETSIVIQISFAIRDQYGNEIN